MEKYVEIAPVVMNGYPDAHHVFFRVMNQRFCVTPHGCETKEEAEWFMNMFCVALAKVAADTDACASMGAEIDDLKRDGNDQRAENKRLRADRAEMAQVIAGRDSQVARLEVENERLRAEHRRIVDHWDAQSELHTNDRDLAATMADIARAAAVNDADQQGE